MTRAWLACRDNALRGFAAAFMTALPLMGITMLATTAGSLAAWAAALPVLLPAVRDLRLARSGMFNWEIGKLGPGDTIPRWAVRPWRS